MFSTKLARVAKQIKYSSVHQNNTHADLNKFSTTHLLKQMNSTSHIKIKDEYENLIFAASTINKCTKEMQHDHFYQLVNAFSQLSKQECLSRLAYCLKKRNAILTPDEKHVNEIKISALRTAIHPAFSIIAIPNRGIIAKKIIKNAMEDGHETILFCTADDMGSPAAKLADHMILVKNYNDVHEIMEKTIRFKTEKNLPFACKIGFNPGYGYLSENPELPEACEENGMVFIGPSAASMYAFGNKLNARKHAEKLGIPVIPGYDGENQDRPHLIKEGVKIGFPLVVKATNGGGGTGNRVVYTIEELERALVELTGQVVLEKYLKNPRHIEVQIFVDRDGAVHFGTRDCSWQREHQKFIEIAPGVAIDSEKMIECALKVGEKGRNLGYKGAGTVEFLVVEENGSWKFYFLEMNTRLQVEHTISELIHGNKINFIKLNTAISSGKTIHKYLCNTLPGCNPELSSQDIIDHERKFSEAKVAIEQRMNAVEFISYQGRLIAQPVKGTIEEYTLPDNEQLKTRGCIDSGIELFSKINTYHTNPNIQNICSVGKTVEEAVENMMKINVETRVSGPGIHTNRDYVELAFKYMSKHEPHIESCKEIDALYLKLLQEREEEKNTFKFTNDYC